MLSAGLAGAWAWASAGAEEPPPKNPPMACPMEDPTATPLLAVSGCLLEVAHRKDGMGWAEGRVFGGGLTQQWKPSGRRDLGRRSAGARPAVVVEHAVVALVGGRRWMLVLPEQVVVARMGELGRQLGALEGQRNREIGEACWLFV